MKPAKPRRKWPVIVRLLAWSCGAALLAALGAAAYLYFAIWPKQPPLTAVTDYQPRIPLRVYSADHVLIGEFGEERREFMPIVQIPPVMKQALLAIEDARFYQHGGIDFIRALGAARSNLRGGYRQGASTITMQVARNFFLTREKTIERKLTEIVLAYRIEAALSKDQILELYMNQIYLGQRAYGFASAAQTYFGKPLARLTLAESAMLAGLPQNPARQNPVTNPKRAKQRQEAVLGRLYELGNISQVQYQQALAEPLRLQEGGQQYGTHAEYVAELARQVVLEHFPQDAYTRGLKVVTTIRKTEQDAAWEALRRNALAYDQRHGYRGPEAFVALPPDPAARADAIADALQRRHASEGLEAAVVLEASATLLKAETNDGERVEIGPAGLRFAAAALRPEAPPALRLRPGAVIRIQKDAEAGWRVVQLPEVASAFVALDANSGAYRALVGGFDFNLQQFNHATQAWRQPGSAIKPLVYSAALEQG